MTQLKKAHDLFDPPPSGLQTKPMKKPRNLFPKQASEKQGIVCMKKEWPIFIIYTLLPWVTSSASWATPFSLPRFICRISMSAVEESRPKVASPAAMMRLACTTCLERSCREDASKAFCSSVTPQNRDRASTITFP